MQSIFNKSQQSKCNTAGIILCMHPASERWLYNVTSSFIGWAYAQNEHWVDELLNHQLPSSVIFQSYFNPHIQSITTRVKNKNWRISQYTPTFLGSYGPLRWMNWETIASSYLPCRLISRSDMFCGTWQEKIGMILIFNGTTAVTWWVHWRMA